MSCHRRIGGPETSAPETVPSYIAAKTFSNRELGTRQRSISRMRSLCSSAATMLSTPHRDVGRPCYFTTIGKGGQTASICFTGFFAVPTRRNSGDVVIRRRHFAIFDTRAPMYAMLLFRHSFEFDPHRNQKFLGRHHLGAGRMSLGLYSSNALVGCCCRCCANDVLRRSRQLEEYRVQSRA
jgi:hypothetical protein